MSPGTHKLLSGMTFFVGALLMTYMMVVESEPGAVPLAMIVVGIGWHVAARRRGAPEAR